MIIGRLGARTTIPDPKNNTVSSDNPSDAFAAHYETLQLEEETIDLGHGETIVPDDLDRFAEPLSAMRTLPRIDLGDGTSTVPDLRVVGTLGEGGMGLVRLARQIALDRDVAVKTLRSASDVSAPKLLQEAYVIGRLEHPNVIPVYTLGRDDEGLPLIVMKRVEGVSWAEVLEHPELAPGDDTPDLSWHLEILVQVCNAVRFAHSHRILHRDIKPENVMIGRFGEVYLLDWGIAISIADVPDEAGLLPHRDGVEGLAGTPAYMAPEMTDNDARRHDERTDVYLLGAVLHEILTGEPRHTGERLFEVMRSSFESKPVDYGEDVPRELAEIANRATAAARDDRYQSADAFQQAIVDFLEHRSSLELSEQAEEILDELRGYFDDDDLDEDANLRMHELFSECRFAARQALRQWPENETARDVYAECLEGMFRAAVHRRDLFGAQSAIADLESYDGGRPALQEELTDLATDLESEKKDVDRLRDFARDLDLSRGRVSRSLTVLVLGALWGGFVILAYVRAQTGDLGDLMQNHIDSTFRSVGIGLLGIFLFRKKLFATAANRRLAYLLLTATLALAFFRGIAALQEMSIGVARSFETAMYGVVAIAGGLLSDDLRISGLGLLYFLVALAEPWVGTDQLLYVGLTHIVVFTGIAWFWTPRQLENRIAP
jgi:serine/threonine-protein kinase